MTQKSNVADAGRRGDDKPQEKLRDRDKGQGVVRDERGQEQPADKRRAQQDAGLRAQKESAAEKHIPSPGEPARGE